MLDTVENRRRLPSALGQTLHRLSVHRTMREPSLEMGIGGIYLTFCGTMGSGERCFRKGVSKSGVPSVAQLGMGWEKSGKRWVILYNGPVFI